MTIFGSEKCLGAKYEAKRIENDEVVYGLAAIEVDDEKSYLIQMFETDDFTDGVLARAHYVAVRTNTITLLEDEYEDDSCQNCGECKCISCAYREDVCFFGQCRRCSVCEDVPLHECERFKYVNY